MAKQNKKRDEWQIKENEDVYLVWTCTCPGHTRKKIHPYWLQENGTPVCPHCEEDMLFLHVEVKWS